MMIEEKEAKRKTAGQFQKIRKKKASGERKHCQTSAENVSKGTGRQKRLNE